MVLNSIGYLTLFIYSFTSKSLDAYSVQQSKNNK